MTTPEPHGDGSQQPRPVYPATAPTTAYTTAPPPPPGAPTGMKAASGLALAALIVGVVAFFCGLLPVFGAIVGLVAVVLGILALRKHQPKGLALTGLILGALATLASIGTTAGIAGIANNAAVLKPDTSVGAPAVTTEPSDVSAPADETSEEPAEEVAEPEEAEIPVEYESALAKAQSYSDLMHFSKDGLYRQLTSDAGEQFSEKAGKYAVAHVDANWNENALEKARSYQETMSMSPEAIRDQLTSDAGEGFTESQAAYAIKHLND